MTTTGRFPFPPLPGAGQPLRGWFLGRSGALLDRPASRASGNLPRLAFAPGSLRLLFRAAQRGWSIYLIGNEDSVARGRVSDLAWERFETGLLDRLRGEGIPIARHYACLDHPRGKGRHRRDSVFRFPNTGALYHAAQEDGIQLAESWVIAGDVEELAAGWRASCRTALVGPAGTRGHELAVEPDLRAPDLSSALAEILACDEYSRA